MSQSVFKIFINLHNLPLKYSNRYYTQGLYRVPLKVLTSQEANLINKRKKVKNNERKLISNDDSYVKLKLQNFNFNFEKISETDKRFGPMINLSKSGNDKWILIEGSRLITEAINTNLNLKFIYFTDHKLLNQIPLIKIKNNAIFLMVNKKEMKIWSDLDTPPGIMAIALKPINSNSNRNFLPITIAIYNVDDENLIGSIIRSLTAANVSNIFYFKDNCNTIWSSKALRSSAGAHFHIPILPTTLNEICTHIANTENVFAYNVSDSTDLNNCMNVDDNLYSANNVVKVDENMSGTQMLGNESQNKPVENNNNFTKFDQNLDLNKTNNFNKEIRGNNIISFQNKSFEEIHKGDIRRDAHFYTDQSKGIQSLPLDLSELKCGQGRVLLILGKKLDRMKWNLTNKIQFISLKEKLMPEAASAVVVHQICRLVYQKCKPYQ